MDLTGEEFTERIRYYCDVLMPARDIVRNGIEKRYHVCGDILTALVKD